MVTTHVELSDEQFGQLRRLAEEEGVSVPELLRRGAEMVVHSRWRRPTREQMERVKSIIGKYDSGLTDVAQRHDDYLAEAYAQW